MRGAPSGSVVRVVQQLERRRKTLVRVGDLLQSDRILKVASGLVGHAGDLPVELTQGLRDGGLNHLTRTGRKSADSTRNLKRLLDTRRGRSDAAHLFLHLTLKRDLALGKGSTAGFTNDGLCGCILGSNVRPDGFFRICESLCEIATRTGSELVGIVSEIIVLDESVDDALLYRTRITDFPEFIFELRLAVKQNLETLIERGLGNARLRNDSRSLTTHLVETLDGVVAVVHCGVDDHTLDHGGTVLARVERWLTSRSTTSTTDLLNLRLRRRTLEDVHEPFRVVQLIRTDVEVRSGRTLRWSHRLGDMPVVRRVVADLAGEPVLECSLLALRKSGPLRIRHGTSGVVDSNAHTTIDLRSEPNGVVTNATTLGEDGFLSRDENAASLDANLLRSCRRHVLCGLNHNVLLAVSDLCTNDVPDESVGNGTFVRKAGSPIGQYDVLTERTSLLREIRIAYLY